MGLIKEPKDIDLSTKSEPWTELELIEFREIIKNIKDKDKKCEARTSPSSIEKKRRVLNLPQQIIEKTAQQK